MSGSMAGRTADADAAKGRVEATKVKRYRPGQVPDWMKPVEDDPELPAAGGRFAPAPAAAAAEEPARRTGVAAPVIVKRADDPRLRRLAEVSPVDRAAAARERHREREVAAPAIVARRRDGDAAAAPAAEDGGAAVAAGADVDEEDEEAVAARRLAVRQRLRAREEAAASVAAAQPGGEDEGEEEEESSGSEYETDDSGGGLGHRPLAKPVFVPRVSRETIAEREALAAEDAAAAERDRLRLDQRKAETKVIVTERLAEEDAQAAAAAAGPKGSEEVITDDEAADEDEEFDAWKVREMSRIARDREARAKEVREAEERERWKAMSEGERAAWLAARPAAAAADKPKASWRFLQKYYHRGAFFQTEAEYKGEEAPLVGEATRRDVSGATGEDRFDRSALPEVMQVKNFGRRSRTKWTHLAAEDTTDKAAPWAADAGVRQKFEARRAGTEQVFTKPKHFKT
jgi:microfibrillar-associated protein 1